MADWKVQGQDELDRLRKKEKTWEPPDSLEDFLQLVGHVIATSKYTDGFIRGDREETLANLRTFVRVKANRVFQHPDIEECVDVAAYAYMVYHLLTGKGEAP